MDHDGQAKLEQEEMDQSEQEKANKTEEDNNAAAAAAEMAIINGQNDNINNNPGRDGDFNCEDLWELEDINQMETAAAAAEFYDVRGGGWGEWKHDAGGETWREWQFYAANNNYEENDWVIDDLWVFEDHHHQPNNDKANHNLDSASATNPGDPKA